MPVTFNSSSRLVNDCGLVMSGSTLGRVGPPSRPEREETKRVLVSGVCKLSEEEVLRRLEEREREPWEELPPPVAIQLWREMCDRERGETLIIISSVISVIHMNGNH